ncbi:MAG: hypothetical protein H8D34_10190 [Chloroflexi bacterium]|nr:hypothetical protein [Chloroflexota bacterium]
MEKWIERQEAGIERVIAKYTWDRTADGYLRVFEEVQKAAPRLRESVIPPWYKYSNPENEIPLETLSNLYF